MKISINALHVLSLLLPAAAGAFGLPWIITIPSAIALLLGAIRVTTIVDEMDRQHEMRNQLRIYEDSSLPALLLEPDDANKK
jgi:hypothetical protein